MNSSVRINETNLFLDCEGHYEKPPSGDATYDVEVVKYNDTDITEVLDALCPDIYSELEQKFFEQNPQLK